MRLVKAACAALIALALTAPTDAAPRKRKPVCVKIYDPGTGWQRICAP